MRWVGRILKWLGLALVALVSAGAIYEQVGLETDAGLAPPPNEMVSVNGRAVHVVCAGNGPQTFVLNAGAGAGTFEWWRLQPLLAKGGRVCAFDRPGLGWSEPSDHGHDAISAADELAALVRTAHIPTPFVYVGHSLGANFGIVYRNRYPHDVAALVLFEPGDPKDLLEDFSGTRAEAMSAPECETGCTVATAMAYIGIPRLVVALTDSGSRNLSGRALSDYRAGVGRPSTTRAAMHSLGALPKTAYQSMDVKTFGDTPVLLFASTALRDPEGSETIEDVKVWRVGYRAYLARLAAMSSHGEGPVEIPDSTHASMVMGAAQAAFAAQRIEAFLAASGR